MNSILEKIKELGLVLPEITKPGGNYVSVNCRGNIAYIAIQFPKTIEPIIVRGRLGKELSQEDGYKAMQICALNVLSHINHSIGYENLLGINHLDAYYQASENWDNAPKIVDGASDLFVNVLGEKGIHSRAIFGVERLPSNFAVGITCTVTIKNN